MSWAMVEVKGTWRDCDSRVRSEVCWWDSLGVDPSQAGGATTGSTGLVLAG